MKKLTVFLSAVILLTACMSKERQEAAAKIAQMWGAQNCTTGTSTTAQTGKTPGTNLTLTLENLKGIKPEYPMENITSISALSFMDALPQKEIEGFDNISITIKNAGKTFEKSYPIKELMEAQQVFITTNIFTENITKDSMATFDTLFDKAYIPDSTITGIKIAIAQIDSAYGRPEKGIITGFAFDHLQDTYEPVIICNIELSNEKAFTNYKLILTRKGKKIIYFGINEDTEA